MATKTITITEEAYQRLSVSKESNESFSDVIKKITKKKSLLDLVGVLKEKEAKELKKYVKETRGRLRKQMEKTLVKIK